MVQKTPIGKKKKSILVDLVETPFVAAAEVVDGAGSEVVETVDDTSRKVAPQEEEEPD